MLINHEKKLIAVAVPKTGSTTLYHGLMHYMGKSFDLLCGSAAVYHLPAQDIRLILGDVYGSYFSFGVVRNPFDRLVSLYHDFKDQRKMIRAETFDEFVIHGLRGRWKNDVHFLPQSYFLFGESGEQIVSKVFKFEDGIPHVMSYIGDLKKFQVGEVAHARKSVRDVWQKYYDNPKIRKIVCDVYERDFVNFGYEMEVAATPQ